MKLDGVGAGGDAATLAGPVGVEELSAGLVEALVGVGAEVVALSLEQVGGQALGAVAVEERQCGGERRRGHTELDGTMRPLLVVVTEVLPKDSFEIGLPPL